MACTGSKIGCEHEPRQSRLAHPHGQVTSISGMPTNQPDQGWQFRRPDRDAPTHPRKIKASISAGCKRGRQRCTGNRKVNGWQRVLDRTTYHWFTTVQLEVSWRGIGVSSAGVFCLTSCLMGGTAGNGELNRARTQSARSVNRDGGKNDRCG